MWIVNGQFRDDNKREIVSGRWVLAREVEEGDFHPALRYSAKSLRSHMKLKDLRL